MSSLYAIRKNNTKKFPRNSSRIRAKKTASSSKAGSKRSCDCNTRTLEMAHEIHSKRSFHCIQRASKVMRDVCNARSRHCITYLHNGERSMQQEIPKNKRDCQTYRQRKIRRNRQTIINGNQELSNNFNVPLAN